MYTRHAVHAPTNKSILVMPNPPFRQPVVQSGHRHSHHKRIDFHARLQDENAFQKRHQDDSGTILVLREKGLST